MPETSPKLRKVEGRSASTSDTADRHERATVYLAPSAMAKLLDDARDKRHRVRDRLLLITTYRHGLRVSEVVGLRRAEQDCDRARLWVCRLTGVPSVGRPIEGDELRAIKRHLAVRVDVLPWLSISEPGQPLTRQAVDYLIAAAANVGDLTGVHPHTPRHAGGFVLADKVHDPRLIDSRPAVRATRTTGRRFVGLWR